MNIENTSAVPERKDRLVHVCVTIRTEYDIDKDGNVINVKNTVLSGAEIPKPGRKSKQPKVTLASIAENYPIVTLYKGYIKFNKNAAKLAGIINENGEFVNTVIGNRIRVQINYKVDQVTKVTSPIIVIDDEEKLVNSQMVRDALSVSCSGQSNAMLAQFGQFFVLSADSSKDIFVMNGYPDLESALKSLNAEIPEELHTGDLVEVDDAAPTDVNETNFDKNPEEILPSNIELNDNGEEKGDEFIPEETKAPKKPMSGNVPEISGANSLDNITIDDI